LSFIKLFQLNIFPDENYLEETKSGKGRPVPINNAQAEVFRELLSDVELKSPFVFSDEKGKPFKNVQKSFGSACRRAGVYDFRFHDLRHTCASWMVMAGADLVAVQKQLGHSSIKTTMRYAHLAPGHMKKAINLIGTREEKQLPSSRQGPAMFPSCSH
jgi:integrase